jgi:hypothetical protein
MDDRVRTELVEMVDRALGTDPKDALIASCQLKNEVEWLTERSVALARREGYDWGRISRQSVPGGATSDRTLAEPTWSAEAASGRRRRRRCSLVKLGVDGFGNSVG